MKNEFGYLRNTKTEEYRYALYYRPSGHNETEG